MMYLAVRVCSAVKPAALTSWSKASIVSPTWPIICVAGALDRLARRRPSRSRSGPAAFSSGLVFGVSICSRLGSACGT